MPYYEPGHDKKHTSYLIFQGLSTMLDESDRLTPRDLVAKVKAMGYDLGLVVDLTNTSRYYNYKVSDHDFMVYLGWSCRLLKCQK